MGGVINRIEPGHALLLQEIDRMALSFGEHCDENVGPGDLFAAGGLHVDRRSLQRALETGSRLGVVTVGGDEVGKLVVRFWLREY